MGFFQSTFVLTAEAEAELEADWSDDPASTGFAVRPATQINTAHIAVGLQLHEPVDSGAGPQHPRLSQSPLQEIPKMCNPILRLLASLIWQRGTIRRSWKLRWNTFVALLGIGIEQGMVRMGLVACASKLNYSQACEQAQLNATTTTVGNAGLLYIYSGVQPSGPAGADGTLVVGPFTMGTPFAPGASAALPSILSPTLPATSMRQPRHSLHGGESNIWCCGCAGW